VGGQFEKGQVLHQEDHQLLNYFIFENRCEFNDFIFLHILFYNSFEQILDQYVKDRAEEDKLGSLQILLEIGG
jgi:hypothetical protein